VIKTGAGTMVLSNANAYLGATTVSNGTLLVHGTIAATGAVYVAAEGTLGGSGGIRPPVSVDGSLSPGPSVGTLTVSNALTLNSGSSTLMEINRSLSTSDQVRGLTSVTFGGTLTVTNLGGTFANGDTFQLFSASSYSGNFSATNLPPLDPSLKWAWNP